MPTKPDISEFYTPELATQEEVSWCLTGTAKAHVAFLLPRIAEHGVKSVIEWGCGTGHVAAGMPAGIDYLGVDKNEWFLNKARLRNKARANLHFALGDVRTFLEDADLPGEYDLATCWFFLKHFALDEWDEVVKKVLGPSRFGAFNMQIADRDFDNGSDYHHAFVTDERLGRAVKAAGHEIVDREVQEEAGVPGHGVMLDVAVWTRRVTRDRLAVSK